MALLTTAPSAEEATVPTLVTAIDRNTFEFYAARGDGNFFWLHIAVLLALIQIKIALLSKHEWMAPLASDMLGKYAGPPKPCRPQFLSTIDATSPFVGHRVVRRTCQYRTKEDDILVGVWHSRRTEPRMRWILDSWGFGGKNIVFLGQSESSSECLPITSTGSPKDDFESTLHKGLVGLARMYDEYPEKVVHNCW